MPDARYLLERVEVEMTWDEWYAALWRIKLAALRESPSSVPSSPPNPEESDG